MDESAAAAAVMIGVPRLIGMALSGESRALYGGGGITDRELVYAKEGCEEMTKRPRTLTSHSERERAAFGSRLDFTILNTNTVQLGHPYLQSPNPWSKG